MEMVFYRANCIGDEKNCLYPHKVTVRCKEDLGKVVGYDHVCAEYKKNYRNADNFIGSTVVPMDCDNDHSEDPTEWITPEKMDDLLPDVSFAMAPSRNHMKVKGSKSARPRYHVYFLIDNMTDPDAYTELKKSIYQAFPFFDDNALDAARFIYGAPVGELVWHEGWVNIDEEIPVPQQEETRLPTTVIPEGRRNKTLNHFAGRVLKRYGITDRAHEIFLDEAKKCDPPLDEEELTSIWNSAVKFAKRIQSQEGYVAPEEYEPDFLIGSLKPEDYSDIGQAKVLTREYGNELCYTDATDFLRYDGEVWNESKQQAVGALEEFLDLQLEDARDMVNQALDVIVSLGESKEDVIAGGKKYAAGLTGDVLDAYNAYLAAAGYKAFVMTRRNMRYMDSALKAAKPMLQISVSDLDRDEFLLNTPGVTYDLHIGLDGGREPAAEDHITKQTVASPGTAGAAEWQKALDLFFCGDRELISYVRDIVGLAAIGKVYVEALIIAYGEGSNGKSTFWNAISRVMGTYSGSISADALTVGCKRNVKPEMAELKGKRLIIAAELEEGMRLNTSVVKQLCSTDEISAEKKYKDPFRFIPSHTLVLYTNHLPRVGANDAGTWRRLIVIPFNAKIEGKGDVKNYADYLVEHAGPAIMQWIIEGAQNVINKNFKLTVPPCVRAAIDDYRTNNDWLGNFLEDCCEVDSKLTQKSGELYQEYRNYCARNGEYTRSTTDFYSALEIAGFERRKSKKGVFVHGLQLKGVEDFLE